MNVSTPEEAFEQVDRLRMALAEAGFPHIEVYAYPDDDGTWACWFSPGEARADTPEGKAIWRAGFLVGASGRCWDCWIVNAESCEHEMAWT